MAVDVSVGGRVLTPANAGTNGGVDHMCGLVTEVVSSIGGGPNGGTVINIKAFPNIGLTLLNFVIDVELMDFEEEARALGIGDGAWPYTSSTND